MVVHVSPVPPQMPHWSSVVFESTIQSQPTFCRGKYQQIWYVVWWSRSLTTISMRNLPGRFPRCTCRLCQCCSEFHQWPNLPMARSVCPPSQYSTIHMDHLHKREIKQIFNFFYTFHINVHLTVNLDSRLSKYGNQLYLLPRYVSLLNFAHCLARKLGSCSGHFCWLQTR